MQSQSLKLFADELRANRELKGISLQQISAKTRIDLKYLTAIESANFGIMPDLYIRAFIKEYAHVIEQDPQAVIHSFELAQAGNYPPQKEVIVNTATPEQTHEETTSEIPDNVTIQKLEKEISGEETTKPKNFNDESRINNSLDDTQQKKSNSKLHYIIGSTILLIAILVLYFAVVYQDTPDIIKEEVNVSEEPLNKFEVINENENENISQPEVIDDSLRIEIKVKQNVWLKVVSDDKERVRRIVQPNELLNYKALNEFSVSIGNAGVGEIIFNGKSIGSLGKLGEIRNIRISKDNIRYLTIPPKKQ
jgi:transcriptional regulator with XRE-family HTH domain